MKKITILCLFLLSISFILVGCTNEENNTNNTNSGEIIDYKLLPQESLADSYEDVSVTGNTGTISLKLPNSWTYETISNSGDSWSPIEYGLIIYPKNVTEGYIEIGYSEMFGVCGTGLETKEILLAGEKASVGTYDGQDYWSFISFNETNIVILQNSAKDWFSDYEDQILEILNTLAFETNNEI